MLKGCLINAVQLEKLPGKLGVRGASHRPASNPLNSANNQWCYACDVLQRNPLAGNDVFLGCTGDNVVCE